MHYLLLDFKLFTMAYNHQNVLENLQYCWICYYFFFFSVKMCII